MAIESLEGNIKGGVLLSRVALVRARVGADGLARVLEKLPRDDRDVLHGIVLQSGWYPFGIEVRLDHAIADELGPSPEIFRAFGAQSAIDGLAKAQRGYARGHDPHEMLRQSAAIYRLYYDTGHRTYERIRDDSAVLRTHESRSFAVSDCLTIVGWFEKAIELCGATRVSVVESRCRTKGHTVCEYLCEWVMTRSDPPRS